MNLIPIKDRDDLFRDPHSHAVINNNKQGFKKALRQKNLRSKMEYNSEKIEYLSNEVSELKNDIASLKTLIIEVLNGDRTN